MAAKFKKGSTVKVAVPQPQGEVKGFRMSDDGDIEYLVVYGENERYFVEDDLELVAEPEPTQPADAPAPEAAPAGDQSTAG